MKIALPYSLRYALMTTASVRLRGSSRRTRKRYDIREGRKGMVCLNRLYSVYVSSHEPKCKDANGTNNRCLGALSQSSSSQYLKGWGKLWRLVACRCRGVCVEWTGPAQASLCCGLVSRVDTAAPRHRQQSTPRSWASPKIAPST